MNLPPPPPPKGEAGEVFIPQLGVSGLPPAPAVSQMWSGSGTFPAEALSPRVGPYVPGDYPKWVPAVGGGLALVHSAEDEKRELQAMCDALPKPWEKFKSETAQRIEALIAADKVDVAAWLREREAPQHDWIGALYRPYEPPV